MDRIAITRSHSLGKGPKYLLHDRDSRYARHFSTGDAGSGIKELRTPYRAPRANGICERFMGSLRRACLDYTLILHGKYLARVVKEYAAYYNHDWLHQGICQQIPHYFDQPQFNRSGEIKASLILGWLQLHLFARDPSDVQHIQRMSQVARTGAGCQTTIMIL